MRINFSQNTVLEGSYLHRLWGNFLEQSLFYYYVSSYNTTYTVCLCVCVSYSQVKDQVMEAFFWNTFMEPN